MYLLEQYFPIMILKLYADYFLLSQKKCLLKFKTQNQKPDLPDPNMNMVELSPISK